MTDDDGDKPVSVALTGCTFVHSDDLNDAVLAALEVDRLTAELRDARDREAAMRKALDRADTCLRHCADYENRAHVDAMNAAHDALTDTDTAAQDWRERVERDALLKASNLAAECEDAIEASSAIRSLANGWDCPDPWEAAIEEAEREARAEGREAERKDIAHMLRRERATAKTAASDNEWWRNYEAALSMTLALIEEEDRDG